VASSVRISGTDQAYERARTIPSARAVAEINVQRSDVELFMSTFHVTVRDDNSSTEHDVTVSASDYERLGAKYRTPELFVRACFEFLLEREPKESILPRFDVSTISKYFPEFETTIQGFDPWA
jgi:hypothetical protein